MSNGKNYQLREKEIEDTLSVFITTTDKINTITITINNNTVITIDAQSGKCNSFVSNNDDRSRRLFKTILNFIKNPNVEAPASLELQEITGMSAEELSTEKSLLLHSYGKIQFDKNIGIGKNDFSKSNLGDIK